MILIILLGCAITSILNDRVDMAIQLVNTLDNNVEIDWFLTGGIKKDIKRDLTNNTNEEIIPEAEKMADLLMNSFKNKTYPFLKIPNKFIYDTISTNTVENFIMISDYLENLNLLGKTYQSIYIITSDFHYNRAKKISDRLKVFDKFKDSKINKTKINWILSKVELNDSRQLEALYSSDSYIELDIHKTVTKLNKWFWFLSRTI